MIRFLLVSFLSLNAINAVAANVTIYKDKKGQALLTIVQPSGGKHHPKVKETYYRNDSSKGVYSTNNKAHLSDNYKINQAIKEGDSESLSSSERKLYDEEMEIRIKRIRVMYLGE